MGGSPFGQKKGGPPLPLIIGGGCGCLALVVIAIVVFVAARGGKDDRTADVPPTPDTPAAPVVAPADQWMTIQRPAVKFKYPPGFVLSHAQRWAVFKSTDGDAVFAVVGFNRPNESTALLGQAAQVLGVGEVAWRGQSRGFVGKENFPAVIGKGVCKFRGVGYMNYATINPGGSDQLLVIYTVSARATETHKSAIQATMASLQHH